MRRRRSWRRDRGGRAGLPRADCGARLDEVGVVEDVPDFAGAAMRLLDEDVAVRGEGVVVLDVIGHSGLHLPLGVGLIPVPHKSTMYHFGVHLKGKPRNFIALFKL